MSNKEMEEFLSQDISLIEKMFSFEVEKRPGYDESKREIKIKNNLSKKFYNKRFKIAKDIIYNENEDKKGILVSSLVKNNIAPRVVEPWIEYIFLLSERYGGWDLFIKELTDEITTVDYMSKSVRNSFIQGTLLIYSFIMLNSIASLWIKNVNVSTIIWVILIGLWIVWITLDTGRLRQEYKDNAYKFMGKNNKDVKEFVKAINVKEYLYN